MGCVFCYVPSFNVPRGQSICYFIISQHICFSGPDMMLSIGESIGEVLYDTGAMKQVAYIHSFMTFQLTIFSLNSFSCFPDRVHLRRRFHSINSVQSSSPCWVSWRTSVTLKPPIWGTSSILVSSGHHVKVEDSNCQYKLVRQFSGLMLLHRHYKHLLRSILRFECNFLTLL